MNIVIDANILFSAMIRKSTTRKMILEYKNRFLIPSYIFEELNKHKEELRLKSGLDKKEFNILLDMLLDKTIIVSENVLLNNKNLSNY